MASIRKRGSNYLIVVSQGYDYQGNRIKPVQKTIKPPLGLTPKAEEKWINEQAMIFEREVKDGGIQIDPSMTMGKYTEYWLEQIAPKKLAVSTLVRNKQDIDRILPALGHYKLVDIKADILRKFYDDVRQIKNKRTGKPLAEMTVEGVHSCVCGILSDAVEEGYLRHNPAWRAYKPKGSKREIFIADEELVQQLIECLEQETLKYETYFKLIILTGMRRGECCGLRWSDIDWKSKEVSIRRSVVKVPHYDIVVKDPKTKAGVRKVYISNEMVSLLREYQEECRWQCEQVGDGKLTEEDYLFRKQGGLPMTPDTFTFRFNKILKKYDLPYELTVHSLRHSNASLLISQNVDVRTVASLLGHAQASTTLDIYSHAFDKTKREASVKLQGLLDI